VSQLSQLSQGWVATAESGGDDVDTLQEFKERAAIMELDGCATRSEGEKAVIGAAVRQSPPTTPRRAEPVLWRGEGLDLGDLRGCLWCRNFTRTGRCLAAWRGELRADRDWAPTFPAMPQRCIGYKPPADDPDQRLGRGRWPDMIAWQARLKNIN